MIETVRRWRKMTWALIAWSGLVAAFSALVIAAAHGVIRSDCLETNGRTHEALAYCSSIEPWAMSFTVAICIGFWFVGFAILSFVWFKSRPKAGRGDGTDPDNSQTAPRRDAAHPQSPDGLGRWSRAVSSGLLPSPP